MIFSRHIKRSIKEIEKYFFKYEYKIYDNFDGIVVEFNEEVDDYEIKNCIYYKSSCFFTKENIHLFYFKYNF
jgi:hypothetical protein